MYLDVADAANLPYGWSRYAQFSLAVVNQIHTRYTIRKGTYTLFVVFILNMEPECMHEDSACAMERYDFRNFECWAGRRGSLRLIQISLTL